VLDGTQRWNRRPLFHEVLFETPVDVTGARNSTGPARIGTVAAMMQPRDTSIFVVLIGMPAVLVASSSGSKA